MSYYPPSENGAKVNMIKQKFEQTISPKEKLPPQSSHDTNEDQKDTLRRSLSASPIKSKKNLKLHVSRQLSNPGKNIKRTPAFRGDKLTRTKNLHSPTKERLASIVNQNVKIFEEQPEYGKIGNVKKKFTEASSNEQFASSTITDTTLSSVDRKSETIKIDRVGSRYNGWRDLKPIVSKDLKKTENTVRTTVISRQKNISPIYTRDENDSSSTLNGKAINNPPNDDTQQNSQLDKFFKNGAEYTKVTKAQKPYNQEDTNFHCTQQNSKHNSGDTVLDIREELSRRISRSCETSDQFDTVDGNPTDRNFTPRKFNRMEKKPSPEKSQKFESVEKVFGIKLTDTLKAALQAPLPTGPPPKKPPRTFAHSPVTRRYNEFSSETKSSNLSGSQSDEEFSEISEQSTKKIIQDNKNRNVLEKPTRTRVTDKVLGTKIRESRDSKKMLEKLEHVLIQHQKALGPKVIMPRKDKTIVGNGYETKDRTQCSHVSDGEIKEKCSFYNRLSRTLEDSKKLGSVTKATDSKARKHSTFDCLPSLNCAANTGGYEQVRNPDFKSYFKESLSLRESQSSISKSENSLESSISNLLMGNSEFYDDLATSPASKRLSTELSTFLVDGKRKLSNTVKNEERVYAEPFAFDKNSGTDITGYGMLSPEEHNYFSRSLQGERFGSEKTNGSLRSEKICLTGIGRKENTGNAKPELHYMCTSIHPLVYEDNNNELENDSGSSNIQRATGISKNLVMNVDDHPVRQEPDKLKKIKVDQLLNQAFGKFVMVGVDTPSDSNTSSDTDSLASSPSMSDELSTFNERLRLFKNRENGPKPSKDELHRSMTEKRKNYVRRVSTRYSERREGESLVTRRNKLFEVCLLVELNLSTKEPYIKDKYPVYANTPAWIENFCFPDATIWPPSDSDQNQFYSLVLMDERGERRYGYCCRVRPEDGPILPLAYCLITKYRASGFYQKVLLELESRHGLPDKQRRSFIEELYRSPMPKPGHSLCLKTDENQEKSSGCSTSPDNISNNNFILSKFTNSSENIGEIRHKTPELNAALINNERTISERMMEVLNNSDTAESVIVRSGDPRLEERDMSQLYDSVSNKVLIILFGSLLLERKVVLLCNNLSKLSSCVEALQSLLYPFTWPHTFIPVLPDIPGLSEILQAPLPFVIGIIKSKNSANTEVASIQDGIVVDLDTSKILYAVGDESSILPTRLQKGIRSALQLVSSNTKAGDGIRNLLVSESFLRVFVETCSHCDSHLVTQQDGKVIFQKESFIKASTSKTTQYFLEWFVETTMFNSFVLDCIARLEGNGTSRGKDDVKLFYQRVAEYRLGLEKNSQSKKSGSKKKTLGDRLKDLTNFHS